MRQYSVKVFKSSVSRFILFKFKKLHQDGTVTTRYADIYVEANCNIAIYFMDDNERVYFPIDID